MLAGLVDGKPGAHMLWQCQKCLNVRYFRGGPRGYKCTCETKKTTKDIVPKERTVYLASTGVDILIQRDIIKRELLRHGYRVLPEQSLPKEAKLLEAMVKSDLEKCRLSIHLIGEDYGYKPKGADLSIVDIQNKIASEYVLKVIEHNSKSADREPF